MASMAQDHTAFMISTQCEHLVGITQLDKRVDIVQEINGVQTVTGNVSLSRTILLDHVTLANGSTLIYSIHQHLNKEPFIIIPNEAEAESLVMHLNHQLPAFLLHYLPMKEISRDFVTTLIQKTCKLALFNDAHKCTWDAKDMVVTCPDEAELAARKEHEEKASQWYHRLLNIHLLSNQPTSPTEHIVPEARYDFDGEKLVTTIHPSKSSRKKKGKQAQDPRTKSDEDGDSSGDNDSSNSASINTNTKPYSSVGFGEKQILGGSGLTLTWRMPFPLAVPMSAKA